MAKLFKAICIFSLISFGFFSCSDKKHHASLNEIEFADIQLDTIAHLFNDTTKPCCDFKLNFTYPSKAKDEAKLKLLQEIFIQTYLGTQYDSLSVIDASHAYMNNYVKDYMQLGPDLKTFEKEDPDSSWGYASFNYSEKTSLKLGFNADGFLSYSINSYTYTGGAHGMYGTSGYVIDIESLNLMTLETIFYKDRYDALARLIVEQIVKDKKLREPSQLQEEGYFSVDEIVPTDNFIIDAKGITWFYNPYEIAVYSTGQTTVSLPWDAVKEFLIEDSPVYFLIERINK